MIGFHRQLWSKIVQKNIFISHSEKEFGGKIYFYRNITILNIVLKNVVCDMGLKQAYQTQTNATSRNLAIFNTWLFTFL